MPKKGRGKGQGDLDPNSLPAKLQTALVALYNHYQETFEKWQKSGIDTPPVFIVVCNNTSASKLVYEWISGWQRPVAEGGEELRTVHHGHFSLLSNFDEHGNRLARPNTLLIDSKQLESGEALDDDFRRAAALEIEQYKREIAQRSGAGEVGELSDSDLLREVMNTVGKKGRLSDHPEIRVVSRDRGGGYGEAAAKALPDAVQVADRWHLMENASAAFLNAVRRSMQVIRTAIGATTINPKLLTCAERLQYEGYLWRKQTNAAIMALVGDAAPLKEIIRRQCR